MSILTFLFFLAVICVAYWAAGRIMKACGITEPFPTIVQVGIVLFGLVWLARRFGFGGGLL